MLRDLEKYSKSRCFGQKIDPSSLYRLKTSLINSHSSIEKYFRNSWVKDLVSSWCHIVRQVYSGAHLVPITVPKTWLNILLLFPGWCFLYIMFFKITFIVLYIHIAVPDSKTLYIFSFFTFNKVLMHFEILVKL